MPPPVAPAPVAVPSRFHTSFVATVVGMPVDRPSTSTEFWSPELTGAHQSGEASKSRNVIPSTDYNPATQSYLFSGSSQ